MKKITLARPTRRGPSGEQQRFARPKRLTLGAYRPNEKSHLRVVTASSPTLVITLTVAIAMLSVIGLLFVLSASMVKAQHQQDSAWYWFYRQAFFLGVGTVVMMVTKRIDYHRWVRLGPLVLATSIVSLLLVLLPVGLAHSVNGARRWLGPDAVRFQPSELAKLGVVLWLAGLLERRQPQMREWKMTILPALCGVVVIAALVVGEPDLGTTTLICVLAFIMLAVAGTRLDVLMAIGIPGSLLGFLFSMRGYHRKRLLAFLDPWADAANAGYQTLQSQVGLASGGFFGVGIGNSRAKWGFLPEAHTDFIFSIIGEETGLVGSSIVILLFFAFMIAGINAGRRSRDLSGLLVAVGISCWIGLQALINIGVSVGALPNKGITLPFVSYGGSSLVMTMFAAGILLNIASQPGTVAPGRARR